MLIVQKYGGATLETPEKIKNIAANIANLKKNNNQIVAVVSAMGQTTNQLIQLAQQVSKKPQLRELDMLLSVGERTSMALVSMALHDLNCDAISFTGSQAGILTDEAHLNAMIKDVKAYRVQEALDKNQVVILAGFQGVSPVTKEITTLGRGGSDTSAVAMAAYLNADRCEILKDVPSIFTADPKVVKTAKPIKKLHYDHLMEMAFWGAKVLHYRSVELAKLKNVKLYVGPAAHQNSEGTSIQGDFMFETSKPLAVNSHSQVFEIIIKKLNISNAINELFNTLQKNQISVPQVLTGYEKNQDTHLMITAPQENMAAIQAYLSKNNQTIELKNENLCSVSLTCTGSTLNDTLLKTSSELHKKNIHPEHFIQSAMSLNYILKQSEKEQAVQVMHSLID